MCCAVPGHQVSAVMMSDRSSQSQSSSGTISQSGHTGNKHWKMTTNPPFNTFIYHVRYMPQLGVNISELLIQNTLSPCETRSVRWWTLGTLYGSCEVSCRARSSQQQQPGAESGIVKCEMSQTSSTPQLHSALLSTPRHFPHNLVTRQPAACPLAPETICSYTVTSPPAV